MARVPSQRSPAGDSPAPPAASEALPSTDARARDELQRAETVAGVGSWAIDPVSREMHWSPGMYALLGLRGTERPSVERFFDHVHPDDRTRLQEQGRASQASGMPLAPHLFRLLRADGGTRVVLGQQAYSTPTSEMDAVGGGAEWRSGTLVDLTERVAQESDLRESEAALARAERISQTGTWSWRPGGAGVRWSDQLYRLLGLEPGAIEPSMDTFRRFVHPDDRARWEDRLAAEHRAEDTLDEPFSFRVVRADGETRELRALSSITRDDADHVVSSVGVLQDVSELVASERALGASETHLRAAQSFAHFGSFEIDITTGERRWSTELYRIFEFDPANSPPTTSEVEARIHPDDRDPQRDWSGANWESAPVRFVESYRLLLPSGVVRTVRSEYMRSDHETSPTIFGVIQDVTLEAKAQRALRESEEKYRRLFESAHVGLTRTRMDDGLLLEANDHFAHMLGYGSGAELLAAGWRAPGAVTGEGDHGDRHRFREELRQRGRVNNWEGRVRRRDGSVLWIRFTAQLDPESDIVDTVIEDVTQARSVGRRMLDAQEGERRRVAAEIHDGPTQRLAAARMLLEAHLADKRSERVPVDKKLLRVAEHLESTLSELRRVMGGLRPSILDDFGLLEAVRSVASAAAAEVERPVEIVLDVEPVELPETAEIVIFRVAQEAITNAMRHSGTGLLEVRLHHSRSQVELTVRDEGCGFAVGDLGADDGRLGLLGMHERAGLVGGRLTIRSAPGEGTTVSLLVPRDEGALE